MPQALDEAASLDELEAEFGKLEPVVKDTERLMGEAHMASSKRKSGSKKEESAAKAFFASSRFMMFAFIFMGVIGFGMMMTFEEESGIEGDKYGVVEDEGVVERRKDNEIDKQEMRFERAESGATNRAVIKDAYNLCETAKYHALTAGQNRTLGQYALTLGYKRNSLCGTVTRFYHEANFFKDKKSNRKGSRRLLHNDGAMESQVVRP